jgi:hypothetical protein
MSLLQKTEIFQFKNLPQPFVLKYWPILRDSLETTIDGKRLTRNLDYQIDYPTGTVTFLNAYLPDATVQVTYQSLPFSIKKQYKRELFQPTAPPPLEGGGEVEPPLQQAGETAPPPLQVTGTQTFGVSFGSGRSLSQNQELRISVDGKVSENVSVTALLSDQDLPIQPEGTTENIQDIDQKLIRITSPNVTATLGDFEGSLGESEFIFFPRALEGVLVEGNFQWGSFHLIPSTIPKGQSTSKTIRGEEGRREYRLDVDGQFIVVKADSELVWLNGTRMRRGESNDYVIRDYGDAIIEFTNKHLITSNDVIRVDFEYIPEDLAYQRNLQGVSGTLNLPGGRATVGLAYAVESDLNDPENAFIILSKQDLEALRKNETEVDGKHLIAPQRHTVWGIEGRLNLTGSHGFSQYAPTIDGQLAFSALDKNTFSDRDAKVLSRAWKLLANTSTDRLQLNLDIRSLDADFVPVGASIANRTRFRYETQYTNEQFDNLYLQGASGSTQAPDEKSVDFNLQVKPLNWLKLDSGLGRTEERFHITPQPPFLQGNGEVSPPRIGEGPGERLDNVTIRNNFNWGVDFNLPKVPRLRGNSYRSASKVEGQDEFRKDRRMWNFSHHIRPFNLNGSIEQLESIDLNLSDGANLNRKRNISTARIDLADFQWASINTSYALEDAYGKDDLLTVDGKALGFSDWKLTSTARTWTIGLFSQPRKWANFSTNLSQRVFREREGAAGALPSPADAQQGLGSDSKTQLADINLRLTPFNRALDGEITYELDKKLATERREIYTNVNPFTGREIQRGEGHYVKIDELHYQEDLENGDYIKFFQNVDDKPVSAIDVKMQLRVQPRRLISRRTSPVSPLPSREGEGGEVGRGGTPLLWLANAINGQIRFDITEEQEEADVASLYLLRNLQNQRTIFGRKNQRYQLEFAPSPLFNIDLSFNTNQTLNKRINNRERWRQSRDWDIGMTLNPTVKLSLGAKWEQRHEAETFTELSQVDSARGGEGGGSKASAVLSDLTQFERTSEIECRYELSRALRFGITGGYEITSDVERIGDEPEARTRTLSLENRLTYSFIGKGRLEFTYRLGYGNSEGGIPFTRYNFYEGLSHEVRTTADYKVRKVTDLLLRFNYRLLSTQQRKPEHRMEMEVVAEL